jgi:hypothetical protein
MISNKIIPFSPFVAVYFPTLSASRPNGTMLDEELEISDRGLIDVSSWNFPGSTKENHETPKPGRSASRPTFK